MKSDPSGPHRKDSAAPAGMQSLSRGGFPEGCSGPPASANGPWAVCTWLACPSFNNGAGIPISL